MNDEKPKVSILMPLYNAGDIIEETLGYIFSQDFDDYELVMVDDCSTDNTREVVRGVKDSRIRYFENDENLGYPGNLERCREKARGEILFLMGQDDVLAKGALGKTIACFENPEIGAVTRPYFWFHDTTDKPVRAKEQFDSEADRVVSIEDGPETFIKVLDPLDQLSGLAYRVEYMDRGFHPDIFPCHIYPFLSIFKKHPVVFLKDYTIAVRISTSQTRKVSSIYVRSPLQSWVDMVDSVFPEPEFKFLREYAVNNFIAKNYVGLVQIRNYGKYKWLLREIWLLLKYRWQNIYNPKFWFFSLGCLLMPPAFLMPLVDWYKENVISKELRDIEFEHINHEGNKE